MKKIKKLPKIGLSFEEENISKEHHALVISYMYEKINELVDVVNMHLTGVACQGNDIEVLKTQISRLIDLGQEQEERLQKLESFRKYIELVRDLDIKEGKKWIKRLEKVEHILLIDRFEEPEEPELKNCPFCQTHPVTTFDPDGGFEAYTIHCENHLCSVKPSQIMGYDIEFIYDDLPRWDV